MNLFLSIFSFSLSEASLEYDAVLLNERLYDFNNQYSDSKVLSVEVSVELSKDLNDIDESVIVQDTMTHYDLSEKYSDEINNMGSVNNSQISERRMR